MGVGYIIGAACRGSDVRRRRVPLVVLMPAIHFFGARSPGPDLSGHSAHLADVVRATCGARTSGPWARARWPRRDSSRCCDTLPTIFGALKAGASKLRQEEWRPHRSQAHGPRHSHGVVLVGSAVLVAMMFFFLQFKPVPGAQVGWLANVAAALLVVFFGFLFVTVSSRIVGLIGSSANPVSGMTIATLMATAAIFLVKGWTAPAFGALAITIGGVVCIAAANAGDTSQDLKTGFIIGATPWKQQLAVMVGVIVWCSPSD